jgi:hypothetical protein
MESCCTYRLVHQGPEQALRLWQHVRQQGERDLRGAGRHPVSLVGGVADAAVALRCTRSLRHGAEHVRRDEDRKRRCVRTGSVAMSREVRRVPADWQHPRDEQGRNIPQYDGALYLVHITAWKKRRTGFRPYPGRYTPDWPESERTHYMMYENTTAGTPISPAFETPEALARWLTDTDAGWFGLVTATYAQWLWVAQGNKAQGFDDSAKALEVKT